METQEAILELDMDTVGYLSGLLLNGTPEQRMTHLYDEEVTFHDGTRLAIQVSLGEDGETVWARGVLFTDSRDEIGHTEPVDEIIGHFRVEHGGQAYVCHVTPDMKVFRHDVLIERRTVTYHLRNADEARKNVDTRDGWEVRRMGPMRIGPSQFSARLGEIVAERCTSC